MIVKSAIPRRATDAKREVYMWIAIGWIVLYIQVFLGSFFPAVEAFNAATRNANFCESFGWCFF